MPLLKTEAAKLSRSSLLRGIIEQVIVESDVLKYLDFVDIVGKDLKYVRENTLGTVNFYAVNDTWAEDAPTGDEVTATLAILGGDADVDQFLQKVYADTNNLRALVIAQKAKAMAHKFNLAFFDGDSVANPTEFDGLKVTCGTVQNALSGYSSTNRAASNGANGAVLTLDTMDEFIDAIKPGKPDVLFMSKRTRRKLSSLRRASGAVLETHTNQFGERVTTYDGIPIGVDENISDNETQGASNTCSSIYGVKFGFRTGVQGIQNGGIVAEPIGRLETKDAWRTRVKWYTGVAYFNTYAYARLAGVKVA